MLRQPTKRSLWILRWFRRCHLFSYPRCRKILRSHQSILWRSMVLNLFSSMWTFHPKLKWWKSVWHRQRSYPTSTFFQTNNGSKSIHRWSPRRPAQSMNTWSKSLDRQQNQQNKSISRFWQLILPKLQHWKSPLALVRGSTWKMYAVTLRHWFKASWIPRG